MFGKMKFFAFSLLLLLVPTVHALSSPFLSTFSLSLWNGIGKRIRSGILHIIEQDDEVKRAYWENLRPSEHCLRYSTRDYTAILVGLPYRETVGTCRETTVEIHGSERLPDFCQNLGLRAGVWGHWIVTTEELDCITTWSTFEDQGCRTNFDADEVPIPGLRRYKAMLQSLQPGDRAEIMCATTPALIEGVHLASPSLCTKEGESIYGFWDLEDSLCEF